MDGEVTPFAHMDHFKGFRIIGMMRLCSAPFIALLAEVWAFEMANANTIVNLCPRIRLYPLTRFSRTPLGLFMELDIPNHQV